MKRAWLALVVALLILAPGGAEAQFDGLRFVELPPVGSWAEYQVLRRNEQARVVTSLKVSFLSRDTVNGQEFFWFQIEQEDDHLDDKRVSVVVQLAIKKEDAMSRSDLMRKATELIVQVGEGQAFRIPHEYVKLFASKNLLSGGEKGGGSAIEYAFRDLEPETVKVKAGSFNCAHKKGLGKSEILLDYSQPNPPRYPVDVILELWFDKSVPFGAVRQVVKQTGDGPQTSTVSVKIDTEESTDLVAYGTGAKSAIKGTIVEYSVGGAARFNPGFNRADGGAEAPKPTPATP